MQKNKTKQGRDSKKKKTDYVRYCGQGRLRPGAVNGIETRRKKWTAVLASEKDIPG